MTKSLITTMLLILTTVSAGAGWKPEGKNISTKWASEVSPSNARPEYPRPQMVRKEWKSLNGLWDYAVCAQNIKSMPKAEGQILVPFCVESSLSGVCRRVAEDQALWYRTTVETPVKWAGKRVLLHFDAVDWKAEVFVNGKAIGTHTGGYTAFGFDVTEQLKGGKAELVLKVTDPTDSRSSAIPRGKQVRKPEGIWYTPVTGIWQSVWLEAVPDNYINDYNVRTNLEGLVSVDVDVCGKADNIQVEITNPSIGYNPEKPSFIRIAKATVKPGRTAELRLLSPKLWTPDSPWLYGLKIKLIKDGKVIDSVDGYTAIRTSGIRKDEKGIRRLALNGKSLFHFGPLDQGWWPDGLYTAPTAEAMAFDIIKTKELGFNMIRKHIKVEPSRWYYDCDRLGIMVWQDMPCIDKYVNYKDWGQGTDEFGAGNDYPATQAQKDNYYKELKEIILQLKKFPSIVCWVPFNEAWGQFDTKKVVEHTCLLDPDRPINAASGGNWIKGAGDIVDSHHYPNPKFRIIDPDKVNVIGEYGGIGRPVKGHVWEIDRKWGYIEYDSAQKVTDTYCLYANDLIRFKQIDGCAAAVYTQTTDVEGEVNGLYTYDRAVLKVDGARVREANLKVINAGIEPSLPLVSPYAFKPLSLFTLRKGELTMQVTDFGARVISLFCKDRDGNYDDVIVGYGDAARYIHNSGERFLGAAVGRVANRIGKGTFSIDGKTYNTPLNNNGQTLHGGLKGIDMLVWDVKERTDSSILFHLTVPDGLDGFPGNLKIEMKYTLTSDNCFDITYKATTDKATPVNLSNHAFYNLKGRKGGTILDHVMTIDADGITPVDEVLIPTGEILPVKGTPFDFREPHTIGERVNEKHEQLRNCGGYDHNWVLNAPADGKLHRACKVYEPSTGRILEIFTDQPGLQFYGGNFFDGSYCGKTEKPIGYREALALEAQKWPDGVNHPNFPNTILHPGEVYTQHTVMRFSH